MSENRGTLFRNLLSRASRRIEPVLLAWLIVATVLTLCRTLGLPLNGDFDDILKLEKIRAFLETGAWFDQSIPGILQPEPFLSHWPRILDLPYAGIVRAMAPLLGVDAALALAAFAVPLLLLLPALAFFRRVIAMLGFSRPDTAFLLALIPAMRAFFEFAPGRIDYHNVQILLLLASIALTFSRSNSAAAASGAVVALALATSIEFAPFFALIMAIHATEFALDREGSVRRLGLFGASLMATALLAYPVIVAPEDYGGVRCDSYSVPHLLGLILAGAGFVVAAALGGKLGRTVSRTLLVALVGAASLAFVAFLYPSCLAGPYAGMNAYVRDVLLADIAQERSLFARPDFVLSTSLAGAAVLFIGTLAPAAITAAERFGHRGRLIFALFALLALALALVQFRYFRYLPLFGGPGIILAVAASLPGLRAKGALLALPLGTQPSRLALAAPGLLLAVTLVALNGLKPAVERIASAATYAGSCPSGAIGRHGWPQGARVMVPPLIGVGLLPEMAEAAVVAVPFHTGAVGVERAGRFLDPVTADPRLMLDESQATHVAICAWRSPAPSDIAARYPFAAALMEGKAPDWLIECPTEPSRSLRIYRYPAAGKAADTCPSP